MNETARKALEVCNQVLSASLTLEAFFERWPGDSGDIFLQGVFSDLEDAVEHTPGRLLSGDIDERAWRLSEERHRVYIDSLLLQRLEYSPPNSQRLNQIRKELIHRALGETDESIRRALDELLGKM